MNDKWISMITIIGIVITLGAFLILDQLNRQTEEVNYFRPPAVPLIVYDPYLSIWSEGIHLANYPTVHWTGVKQNLISLIRIDGKTYRLMGNQPKSIPTLAQKNLKVFPLCTVYSFEGRGISVTLTFLTPRLPSNLKVFSWPISYLTWEIRSIDGKSHNVQIYYSTSSRIVADKKEKVISQFFLDDGLQILKVGSKEQPVLQKVGDRVALDWGYVYTAVQKDHAITTINESDKCLQQFIASGDLPKSNTFSDNLENVDVVEAISLNFGNVESNAISRHVIVGINEENSVNYFGTFLHPYWMHWYSSMRSLLINVNREYKSIYEKSVNFDQEVMSDCEKVGGKKYAQICALAYRQSIGAIGIAEDQNGQPLLFTKENTSNGDISTVDVIYPTSPLFLLFNPELLKGMLIPILDYSKSILWRMDFAPHDLGMYPDAIGHFRKLGDVGEQMPVEETGNMLIMMDAIAQAEGNVDFSSKYWPLLTKWSKYLLKNGFDPGNQLCTDDFAGPMPHNANLSAKSIEAIGAYAQLCEMRGDKENAKKYMNIAQQWARRWSKIDLSKDGTHYLLGFDSSQDSWSQKYNIVWDEILNLNLFPKDVIRRETNYYLTKLQAFGLPLDSRKLYTKTDWTIWIASLRPNTVYFHELVNLVYKFLNDTPSRVPMADFYWTQNGYETGMFARSVVGGVFMTVLTNKTIWNKWISMSDRINGTWAPLPKSYFLLEPLE